MPPFESFGSHEPDIPSQSDEQKSPTVELGDLQARAGELAHNMSGEQSAESSFLHKGEGIDNSLSAPEIQQKIDELEGKGLNALSDEEFDLLFAYQDQLLTLENQTQEVNRQKISEDFDEIKGYLGGDILAKYPDLQNILNAWDGIQEQIANLDPSDTQSEKALYTKLKTEVTGKALTYLKNNEQVLAHIYRNIENTQGEEQATAFRTFLVNQDPEFSAIFKKIDGQDAHIEIALDGSDIADVDGDIIRGENGELLDMSGDTPKLSLEGEDGLKLEVGEVDAAKTEAKEQEISDMQSQIEANTQKIEQNKKRLARYTDMLADLKTYDPKQFDTPDARTKFKDQLVSANPELEDISPDIDFTETGHEFLTELISYISQKKDATEKSTEVLKAENMKLTRDAGILAAKVETQKRLAAEKLRDKKERVEASRDFYEKSASSSLVAKIKHLFARISEASPVVLPNGKAVTHFDIATFEIIPSPWEGDANDTRHQELYLAIINKALGAPMIELGTTGHPVFKQNGEIIDRMKFEGILAEKVGSPNFEMQAVGNLFGVKQEEA